MSIVSLAGNVQSVAIKPMSSVVPSADRGSRSDISDQDLCDLAAQLNVEISEYQDNADYLVLLRSLEAVLRTIQELPDYIVPGLLPQKTAQLRSFSRPLPDHNPLNAWSHQCDIRSATLTGELLIGRTVAIKDNISVGGLPTTLGVPQSLFSGTDAYPISPIDATVVSRILASGGIIKGTTTCESFCASPLSFTSSTGPVHNPLVYNYTAGGSSSGSAALVAAHRLASTRASFFGPTVEMAIGSDQAGSVRIPAAYNGIYGLKPTFGLIPYTGAASMSPMIDHLGPLATELEDIAALLEVMAGYDGYDPRMTPETPLRSQVKPYRSLMLEARQEALSTPKSYQTLKIGLLSESFSMPGVAADVRDTVYRAAKRCFQAVGATVVDISIPMHEKGPVIWTAASRPSMSAYLCQGSPSGHLSYLSPHTQTKWPMSQESYELLTSTNPAVMNIIFSEKYVRTFSKAGIEAKAHRLVFELRAAYDRAFEDVDVLVTPCAPTVAMPHPAIISSDGRKTSILDRLGVAVGITSNTCPFNVTGHPGLNVPCGFSFDKDKPDVPLPVGMQIVGRRWADEQVLQAAAFFERGRDIVEREFGSAYSTR